MLDFTKFKKFFLFGLIGSLIVSALVAVVTVLTGDFNDITVKVLLTLLMVVIHSMISLLFIWDDEKQNIFEKLSFVTNVIFALVVASFVTSIFGVWKIFPGDTVLHLYQTYMAVFFASLYINVLNKALNKEKYIDNIVYANYLFVFILFAMLQPVIYIDNAITVLGDQFFRFFGAAGIIDGTLSILIVIFYKLYLHKHPELDNITTGPIEQKTKRGLSIWIWILIIYLALQFLIPFIIGGFGR